MNLADRAVTAIDDMLAASRTSEHQFLMAWSAGELTRDDLRGFASQFYHLVDALPRSISRVHAATGNPALRRPLVAVLAALDGTSPTPADLWLQTCATLGLFSDSVRRSEMSPGTEQCVFTLSRLAADGPPGGIASIYALLRELPLVCRLQRDALVSAYGMNDGPGLTFYDSFGYQVESHARVLRELLTHAIDTDEQAREAQSAAHEALEAFKALLTSAATPAEPAPA